MHATLVVLVLSAPIPYLAPGFDAIHSTPLPGGATTSTQAALNPADGTRWLSNGLTFYQLDGDGNAIHSEPAPNGLLSTDLLFTSDGTMWANNFNVPGPDPIYFKPPAGSWTLFASVDLPRDMKFHPNGNLIVIGGNGDPTLVGSAWSIDPMGSVSTISTANQGESFVIDGDGDLIIPYYMGIGLERLTLTGTLTTEFSWARDDVALYESIALTPSELYYILGVHKNDPDEVEYDEIIRVNAVTGERELIARDTPDGIPVDMYYSIGGIDASFFGSAIPVVITGPFEASLDPIIVPEPSTGVLALMAIAGAALRYRRCKVSASK